MGSYTLPPFALYKPSVGETGWGTLVDSNFDLLAANSNAQLALGMFDYPTPCRARAGGAGLTAPPSTPPPSPAFPPTPAGAAVPIVRVAARCATGPPALFPSAAPARPATTRPQAEGDIVELP